jgi:hypothetical protein
LAARFAVVANIAKPINDVNSVIWFLCHMAASNDANIS